MAGFFSPGLGFASTAGAFIGGAAQEGSKLLDQQRSQDRQDDLIWMNRFDRGAAEYNKEKKDADQKAQVYGNFLRLAGGNKNLADTAMNHVLLNPKGYEDAVQMITTQKDNPAYKSDNNSPGYDPYSGLGDKFNNLQNIHQNARPQAQRFMSMPEQYQSVFGGGQQQQPQMQPGQPSMIPQGQPQLAADTSAPPAAPDTVVGQPSGGPQAAPIPTQTQQPPQPQGSAPPTGRGGLYGNVIKPETQAQSDLKNYRDRHLEETTRHNKVIEGMKPPSPEANADIALAQATNKFYLDDPKTGLQPRHSQLPDYQSQLNDINGISGMLNTFNSLHPGLKADVLQPALGEINRWTTAALGLDLSQMGLTNPVGDVNLMKKEIANAMIDRLKTLHFGRITNYTENIVKQGMPATSNDPNTNMKIMLAMKEVVRSAMEGTQIEYNTAFGTPSGNATMASVGAARLARQQYLDKYMKEHDSAPWLQINLNKDMNSKLPSIAKLAPGTWFENADKGGSGQMYQFVGPSQDGNFIQFRDASGNVKSFPAPR